MANQHDASWAPTCKGQESDVNHLKRSFTCTSHVCVIFLALCMRTGRPKGNCNYLLWLLAAQCRVLLSEAITHCGSPPYILLDW